MGFMSVTAYRFLAAVSFIIAFVLAFSVASIALAQVVTASSPVRAGTVLHEAHLSVAQRAPQPGTASDPADVIGLETRVSLYPGRPIQIADLGPPTIVRRSQLVTLVFRRGGLMIRTDGRALDGGGMGERIRVMNLDSRLTVTGTIAGPQLVEMR